MNDRDNIIKDLDSLKEKAKFENSTYRKNEQELELLILKQDSIQSEIFDNRAKIVNINTKLKLSKKELTNLEREKRDFYLNYLIV